MTLKSPHREWRLEMISPVDVRAVGDLDQLLARLWLRVLHGNRPLLARSPALRQVSELTNELEHSAASFRNFDASPGAAETWLRADLVKTLKRSPEIFTVARPVHALATRVRSVDKQTDDSSASLAVYSWLEAVDPELLAEFREFIDVPQEEWQELDLATFALALFGAEQGADQPKQDEPDPAATPLCLGQARSYADDARRLLAYRGAMPRSALVDHLRRLTGFHVGLYLLRVFRIVADLDRDGHRICDACREGRPPEGACPYRLDLLVDCGEDARSPVAKLAERSWADQENVLGRYVRAHLAFRKLHEFAVDHEHLSPLPTTLEGLAALEGQMPDRIDMYFVQRISLLTEESPSERVRELEAEYRALGMSSFRTYVALLAHFSERRWFNYHRYLVDSLFSKNSNEGVMRQPLGGPRRRRAAIGPALMETLALIAVVEGAPGSFFTRPLRVDQLIERLEERYDVLIARPPAALVGDIEATRELAVNVERFKNRLRETGLFTDLSDAYLAQLVRPRHHLVEAS